MCCYVEVLFNIIIWFGVLVCCLLIDKKLDGIFECCGVLVEENKCEVI